MGNTSSTSSGPLLFVDRPAAGVLLRPLESDLDAAVIRPMTPNPIPELTGPRTAGVGMQFVFGVLEGTHYMFSSGILSTSSPMRSSPLSPARCSEQQTKEAAIVDITTPTMGGLCAKTPPSMQTMQTTTPSSEAGNELRVSRRRVGQRRLRFGDRTHTFLVGHVLKSDRTGVSGCSMSGCMRFRARILTTFTCLCAW